MKKLLVTTALEETWGKDEDIVFLGEWCRLYQRRDKWKKRNYEIVPYHWDNRRKLRQDHDYLKDLHERLLVHLSDLLNDQNKVDYSTDYWRKIISHWLIQFLAVVFDRWEHLRLVFDRYSGLTVVDKKGVFGPHLVSYDLDAFEKMAGQEDSWNYLLFLEILESEYSGRCNFIRNSNDKPNNSDTTPIYFKDPGKHKFKFKLAKFFDSLVGKISKNADTVFYKSYAGLKDLVILHTFLFQFPRLYLKEFDYLSVTAKHIKTHREIRKRDKTLSAFYPRNNFERFLKKRIIRDIPYIHLEGFDVFRSISTGINLSPKFIFTANAHWNNEIFKFWVAEKTESGSKLFTIQHGGGISLGSLNSMDYEEIISEVHLCWGLPTHPKHYQLPSLKISRLRKKRDNNNVRNVFFSVIALDLPRYALKAWAGPISGQVLAHYEQTISLYKNLTPDIKRQLKIRPSPDDLGWNLRQKYIDALGLDKISQESSYKKFLANSKIILCTYPQTTLTESMCLGIPTVLLYPDPFWELHSTYQPLYKLLKEKKIIFHDPVLAANHINSIWRSPGKWWNSTELLALRDKFEQQAAGNAKYPMDEWKNFIKKTRSKE